MKGVSLIFVSFSKRKLFYDIIPPCGRFFAMKQQAQLWAVLLRPGFTARGVLTFLMGALIAWSLGYPVNWGVLVISSICVICVLEMAFLVNYYFETGNNTASRVFQRVDGSSLIKSSGFLLRRMAAGLAIGCSVMAVICGLVLQFIYSTGIYTISLCLLGLFIGYYYTARPFRLSSNYLGEITVWFGYGWLAASTGYYLQTGQFDLITALVSFPGAVSIFLVVLAREVMDMDSDQRAGGRNLAALMGIERTRTLYIILIILSYTTVAAIIVLGVPLISGELSVILIPLVVLSIRDVARSKRETGKSALPPLKTMLYDQVIMIIYLISFMVAGWGDPQTDVLDLVVIGVLLIACFAIEAAEFAIARRRGRFPGVTGRTGSD
jgi:1,4-dihydroxy-2-naphthoate octaprenyltransferase